MYTNQLQCCIDCDAMLPNSVVGVFAADRLPQERFYQPYGLIVNTDIHSKKGRHWLGVFDDGLGNMEIIDSFGRSPRENSFYISNWINECAKTLQFNKIQIQSELSNVCGLYCLLYLRQRFLGGTLQRFMNAF